MAFSWHATCCLIFKAVPSTWFTSNTKLIVLKWPVPLESCFVVLYGISYDLCNHGLIALFWNQLTVSKTKTTTKKWLVRLFKCLFFLIMIKFRGCVSECMILCDNCLTVCVSVWLCGLQGFSFLQKKKIIGNWSRPINFNTKLLDVVCFLCMCFVCWSLLALL